MSAPKVEFDFHLENPAIAAQADPVHRVVRVGDCKHLEEEEVVGVVEVEMEDKEKHHATWHPGKELTEEKTEVSIVQSGDMSTECE